MFPISQPYLARQLVDDRIASLRADADRSRSGRPLLARWRPARFVEPAADLSRVVPATGREAAEADQAA